MESRAGAGPSTTGKAKESADTSKEDSDEDDEHQAWKEWVGHLHRSCFGMCSRILSHLAALGVKLLEILI